MSRHEVVKLAKEILENLPEHVRPSTNGNVLKWDGYENLGSSTVDHALSVPCEVCARGAFIIAHLLTAYKPNDPLKFVGVLDDEVYDLFAEKDYNRIEGAFEGWRVDEDEDEDDELDLTAWAERYPEPRRRLRAICHNLIRNEGRFVPTDFFTKEVLP